MPPSNYEFQCMAPIKPGDNPTRLDLPPSKRGRTKSTLTVNRQFSRQEKPKQVPFRDPLAVAPEAGTSTVDIQNPEGIASDRESGADFEISPLRTHKIRDTGGEYSWWESKGKTTISNPPTGLDNELEEGHIFVHWARNVEKCQLWVIDENKSWTRVAEGHGVRGPGGLQLHLVITEGRQPSLVQGATWEKQYKRRPTPVLV
ncbi:hypothetical protein BJ138DRAFT_1182013 [Hygrophoropsis aurantiaca]|uniref:Uncharacterized protein n=1 Tax=Hygrophoropsis aurantiaca TaxID=72124 RepID=A0ACB8A4S3_9AGAM|nr:hypothetical protein BJ138DRAFT_1182013 [Hygrophoropsis aurantiaca]